MITARSAKDRLRVMLNDLNPSDVTDEEAETMASVLQRAYERKYAGVINIRTVRRNRTIPR